MNLLYTYPSRKILRLLPGVAMKPVPKPSPEIVEGHQSRNEIGRLCRKYGFTNVMIITDKVLYSLGFHETVVRSLEDSGIRYGIFNEIASEPDDNIIDAALNVVRESGAQCIIAIGAMYHIPHGNAIALCMIPVLEWLKPYCIAKYAEMSRMCGFSAENENDAVAADRFLAEVAALMKKCGLSLDGFFLLFNPESNESVRYQGHFE